MTINVSPGASSTDELLQKLSAGFAGGNYPDISYAFGSWASELEASGRTLDITDQVQGPGREVGRVPARRPGQTAQPTGETTIGFPAVVDNLSLIYNKTVFDAAGVDYPTDDWTWDDFRDRREEADRPAHADLRLRLLGLGHRGDHLAVLAAPVAERRRRSSSDDQKTATFDSHAGVDALTFLRAMAVDDKSVYLDQTDTKFAPAVRRATASA